MERREAVRRVVKPRVRVSTSRQPNLPVALAIDVSEKGMLVNFSEPIGLLAGERVVASIGDEQQDAHWCHVVGHVARVERSGTDMLIAVEFDEQYRAEAGQFLVDIGAASS